MKCWIYKSSRRDETYVYLRERDAFTLLPEALVEQMGTLVFVMELELSADRKLAREHAPNVMASLTSQGFHLQVPPPEQSLLRH